MGIDPHRYRGRVTDRLSRWCILRTSGGQTLPLARSLTSAGFDVWTPARSIRRVMFRGSRGERQAEIEVPILPTFVFAIERHLAMLADAATWQISPHPAFSIFRHSGRIPLIADRDVAGLRAEEQRAAATAQAMRDADTRDEAERIRISALKSEAARRRATKELERARFRDLRDHARSYAPGTEVAVAEMPAMIGMTGVVQSNDGSLAWVQFGTQSWKIETWRLSASSLDET